MDGAIPGSGSESLRQLAARFQSGAFSGGSANYEKSGQSVHAGLFEQFLSMPAPVRIQPARPADPPAPAKQPSDDARDSAPPQVTAAESPDERDATTAEDEAERGAVEDQVALLSAAPVAATPVQVSADEDSAEKSPSQPLTDDRLTAEQGEGEQPVSCQGLSAQEAAIAPVTADETVTAAARDVTAESHDLADAFPRAQGDADQLQQQAAAADDRASQAATVKEEPTEIDASDAANENALAENALAEDGQAEDALAEDVQAEDAQAEPLE